MAKMKKDILKFKSVEIKDKKYTSKSKVQPCPVCGKNEAKDCGYLEGDDWIGYDCACDDEDVEERGYDCGGCPKLACMSCMAKGKNE